MEDWMGPQIQFGYGVGGEEEKPHHCPQSGRPAHNLVSVLS